MKNVKDFNSFSNEEKFRFFKDNEIELIHYDDGIEVFELMDSYAIATTEEPASYIYPVYELYSNATGVSFPISFLEYVENSQFKLTDENGDYYNLFAVKLVDALDNEGNVKDLK